MNPDDPNPPQPNPDDPNNPQPNPNQPGSGNTPNSKNIIIGVVVGVVGGGIVAVALYFIIRKARSVHNVVPEESVNNFDNIGDEVGKDTIKFSNRSEIELKNTGRQSSTRREGFVE